ncbi:hypothetical protein E4U12_001259, partial [Claviceps purpurea]
LRVRSTASKPRFLRRSNIRPRSIEAKRRRSISKRDNRSEISMPRSFKPLVFLSTCSKKRYREFLSGLEVYAQCFSLAGPLST